MQQYTPEELIKYTGGSVYKLVLLASKRAGELNIGAPKLIDGNFPKTGSLALEEIRQGKLRIKGEVKENQNNTK
jgi:DNA-directed RNA polymerase omega subunit